MAVTSLSVNSFDALHKVHFFLVLHFWMEHGQTMEQILNVLKTLQIHILKWVTLNYLYLLRSEVRRRDVRNLSLINIDVW